MALDGTQVRPNPGTLRYTPDGGSAQDIGYTKNGVELFLLNEWVPVTPEELGRLPLDYIYLAGPVIAIATGIQWDAALRNQLADFAISASSLVFTTTDIGKLATALGFGALAFVTDTTGHLSWTAPRAVPLLNERAQFAPRFRKREVIEFGVTFGILPPAAGGTYLTLVESS